MVNSEDNVKGMPIERNYEPHIQGGDMFLNKQFDDHDTDNSFDSNSEIDKNEENKNNSNDRGIEHNVGSTGACDEYTATIDMSISKRKNFLRDSEQKIADMNIEGMPWFHDEIEVKELLRRQTVPELNRRETSRVIFSSLLAALMVAGIFVLALFLFLLFCTKVWF